jgi:hypothetical protein
LTLRESALTPTRMPPDLPCGGKQNQIKLRPPVRFLKKGAAKFDLPVSRKATRSNFCSLIVYLIKRCLPGCRIPSIFQIKAFIYETNFNFFFSLELRLTFDLGRS